MIAIDWHQRFLQQASWSRSAREYFIKKNRFEKYPRILEVGCGTGAVLSEFEIGSILSVGIDINRTHLLEAQKHADLQLVNANGYEMPFQEHCFDLVFCHYLLLWLEEPIRILTNMKQLLKPGGWLCLFAEPDYSARIDYPGRLKELGSLQNRALASQGVHLETGRHLRSWLVQIGMDCIEYGILGGNWDSFFDEESWQMEWDTLIHDLSPHIPQNDLARFQEEDKTAWLSQERILFIPTFYAWGQLVE